MAFIRPATRYDDATLAQALTRKGLTGMIAWVLEQNRSLHFYERTGARALDTKRIEIDGTSLPVRAFGWPSLSASLYPERHCSHRGTTPHPIAG